MAASAPSGVIVFNTSTACWEASEAWVIALMSTAAHNGARAAVAAASSVTALGLAVAEVVAASDGVSVVGLASEPQAAKNNEASPRAIPASSGSGFEAELVFGSAGDDPLRLNPRARAAMTNHIPSRR